MEDPDGRDAGAALGCCSSTNRRASRRTTSSSARRATRRRAASGTPGTLDPFATGLLVLLLGTATRLAAVSRRRAQGVRGDDPLRRRAPTPTTATGDVSREAAPPRTTRSIARSDRALTGAICSSARRRIRPRASPERAPTTRRVAGTPLELEPVGVHAVRRWDAVDSDRTAPTEFDATITCSGGNVHSRARARPRPRVTGSAAHLAGLRRTQQRSVRRVERRGHWTSLACDVALGRCRSSRRREHPLPSSPMPRRASPSGTVRGGEHARRGDPLSSTCRCRRSARQCAGGHRDGQDGAVVHRRHVRRRASRPRPRLERTADCARDSG